jgi:hypothetical protein
MFQTEKHARYNMDKTLRYLVSEMFQNGIKLRVVELGYVLRSGKSPGYRKEAISRL